MATDAQDGNGQQDRIEELEAERLHLRFALQEQEERNRELNKSLDAAIDLLARSAQGSNSRGSDEEEVYYGSRARSIFHRPNCEWALYILPSANLVRFDSHAAAVHAGYKPCKTCRA